MHLESAILFGVIGAVIGCTGTAIAFLNYKNTVNRQQVKLQVTPAPAWTTPQGDPGVSVDVVNLSPFAVDISELGLKLRSGKRVVAYALTSGRSLPQRLESRQSVTALIPKGAIDLREVTVGYARTACGHEATGDSPGLQSVKEDPSLLSPMR